MKVIVDVLRKHAIKILLVLVWASLFLSGLWHYAGSKTLFALFSLASLALLLNGLYRRVSFGYLFLAVLLWLGFWFKLTANLFLFHHYLFAEPVGNFDSSPASWDAVLMIASVSCIGLIFGRLAYVGLTSSIVCRRAMPCAPAWYKSSRITLWSLAFLVVVGVPLLNLLWGIHQVGKVPETILPWPGNALIAWILNIGTIMFLSVLLWWELADEENQARSCIYLFLMEAFTSSITVISRIFFLLHVIPPIVALRNEGNLMRGFKRGQKIVFVAAALTLFAVALLLVSKIRDVQYLGSLSTPTPAPKLVMGSRDVNAWPPIKTTLDSDAPRIASWRPELFHQLFVGRWIGLEGIMAISKSNGNGAALFWEMLTEKREIGQVTAYQKVSKSGYQTPDAKYQFASVPGISGFLYYSGSLLGVFMGMAGIALFVCLSERVIYWLTNNPIICSLYGMILANTITQFGVTPRQDVPQYFMIYLAVVLVWFVQSRYFAWLLFRIGWFQQPSNRKLADRKLRPIEVKNLD